MTTAQDEELLFAPLHALFVFVLVGIVALILLFAFIALFAL